jgi:hypothetical protein
MNVIRIICIIRLPSLLLELSSNNKRYAADVEKSDSPAPPKRFEAIDSPLSSGNSTPSSSRSNRKNTKENMSSTKILVQEETRSRRNTSFSKSEAKKYNSIDAEEKEDDDFLRHFFPTPRGSNQVIKNANAQTKRSDVQYSTGEWKGSHGN